VKIQEHVDSKEDIYRDLKPKEEPLGWDVESQPPDDCE
jgi:hypothetical protein